MGDILKVLKASDGSIRLDQDHTLYNLLSSLSATTADTVISASVGINGVEELLKEHFADMLVKLQSYGGHTFRQLPKQIPTNECYVIADLKIGASKRQYSNESGQVRIVIARSKATHLVYFFIGRPGK